MYKMQVVKKELECKAEQDERKIKTMGEKQGKG